MIDLPSGGPIVKAAKGQYIQTQSGIYILKKIIINEQNINFELAKLANRMAG